MGKILIIDDDLSIVDAVKTILELEGYTVICVTQAEYALAKAKLEKPDIVLLDFLLSGVDGIHIAQKLKGDEQTKHIPIIMFSAAPGAEKSVLGHGADAFLEKPFDIEDLLQKINIHLLHKKGIY